MMDWPERWEYALSVYTTEGVEAYKQALGHWESPPGVAVLVASLQGSGAASAVSEEALVVWATSLDEAGLPAMAGRVWRAGIQVFPQCGALWYGWALCAIRAKAWKAAQHGFQQVLRLDAAHVGAWFNLGGLHSRRGAWAQAIQMWRQVLARQPDFERVHLPMGNALLAAGMWDEARARFESVVALHPACVEAWCQLGVVALQAEAWERARDCYDRALALAPELGMGYQGLGNVAFREGKLEESRAWYETACEKDPHQPIFAYNLAVVCMDLRCFEAALRAYDQALVLKPDYVNARVNRGMLHLMLGDYPKGWPDYTWRLQRPSFPKPKLPMPFWEGQSLAGKRLLLLSEQGFGDTLMCLRFLPRLRAMGAELHLVCRPELLTLLQPCPDLAGVSPAELDEPVPPVAADYAIYLMSLPGLLDATPETLPAPGALGIPLSTALNEHWASRLATLSGLKVGLVWASKADHPTHEQRSCALATLGPLLETPGVSWVSLQKPCSAEDGAFLAEFPAVADWTADIRDFADTAALIAGLDLVISVDTAVVHLGGVLGKPVWVLLPAISDWRWGLQNDPSPWYPDTQLFRQKEGAGWPEVVSQVQDALAQLLAAESAQSPLSRLGDPQITQR